MLNNAESWVGSPSGVSGARLMMGFAGGRLRHELYFQGRSPEANQRAYNAMLAQRDVINAAYGRELSFESLGITARVAEDRPEADVSATDRCDEFIEWFIETGDRWRRAIAAVGVV